MAKDKKKSPNEKPISLYPLEFEEALKDILEVKPEKKEKKKNKKGRQ